MDLLVKKYNLDMNGDINDKPLNLRHQHAIEKLENELSQLEAEMVKVSKIFRFTSPAITLESSVLKMRKIFHVSHSLIIQEEVVYLNDIMR